MGNEELAVEALSKALELNPREARIWYFKALFYAGMKDRENTLSNLRKAIEIDRRYSAEARTEEVFEYYGSDPDFRALTSTDPAALQTA